MTANLAYLEEKNGVNERTFVRSINLSARSNFHIFTVEAIFTFFCAKKRKNDISCKFIRTKSNYNIEKIYIYIYK